MNNLFFVSMFGRMGPVVYILVLSELVLKGVTLYKSAQREQKGWFVALLIINSLGLLPIIYLIMNKDIGSVNEPVVSKNLIARKSKKSKK